MTAARAQIRTMTGCPIAVIPKVSVRPKYLRLVGISLEK